jgi:hypothetical protein
VRLLPQLVQHLLHTGASATVLAPDWPAQPWYAPLMELADEVVRLLPRPPVLATPFVRFPECRTWTMLAVRVRGTATAPRLAA